MEGQEIKMHVDVSVDTEKITEQVRAALDQPARHLARALYAAAWNISPEFVKDHEQGLMNQAIEQERLRVLADDASRTSDTMDDGSYLFEKDK